GHVEALVSGGAANRVAREVLGPDADSRQLLAQAREGKPRAAEAVEQMGRHLGSGIASLVNIFEPEVIVIGGGFASAAAELLLPPAREVLAYQGLVPRRDRRPLPRGGFRTRGRPVA